jgi:hypothetical protein
MILDTGEFLVFIAIVTSVIVLQARQHDPEQTAVAARSQSAHKSLSNPRVSVLKNMQAATPQTRCKA